MHVGMYVNRRQEWGDWKPISFFVKVENYSYFLYFPCFAFVCVSVVLRMQSLMHGFFLCVCRRLYFCIMYIHLHAKKISISLCMCMHECMYVSAYKTPRKHIIFWQSREINIYLLIFFPSRGCNLPACKMIQCFTRPLFLEHFLHFSLPDVICKIKRDSPFPKKILSLKRTNNSVMCIIRITDTFYSRNFT